MKNTNTSVYDMLDMSLQGKIATLLSLYGVLIIAPLWTTYGCTNICFPSWHAKHMQRILQSWWWLRQAIDLNNDTQKGL